MTATKVQWRASRSAHTIGAVASDPTEPDPSRVDRRLLARLRVAKSLAAGRADPDDFSIVLGGPLYQLVHRAHLSGDALQMLRRRIVVLSLVAWLPLVILAAIEGRLWGSAVTVPLLLDIEVHVRFLVTLPLLVIAELVVHQRMRPVVRQFLERGLIDPTSLSRFDAAVASALRLRNSAIVEAMLLVLVYVVGFALWPLYGALHVTTWYAAPDAAGRRELFAAGWWFACVSLPFFQFLLLRWYFRLFIWTRFLWQVSRWCRLRLVPTHPDRLGGLGFLSGIMVAFAPLLAAHGTLLSASIAMRIFFQGAALPEFAVELAAVAVFLLLVTLGPLLVFIPHLEQARRTGLREYGTLAQTYVREFDEKWLRRGTRPGDALLGSPDIQSLADLGSGYEVVASMRVVPFTLRTVLELVVMTILPVAPLLLTKVPIEELFVLLLRLAF